MNLEDQVCSLKLAKKLKKLGLKQESQFYWIENIGRLKSPQVINEGTFASLINSVKKTDKDKFYSAFTVAELINLLPLGSHCGKAWRGKLEFFAELQPHHQEYNESLADALAGVLISYLQENKLI